MSLVDGSVREIRFGVADDRLRSLSFKLWRSGQEVYLQSRDFDERKYSLHSSGRHRYAVNQRDPRAPIAKAELLAPEPGAFWTVARIFVTTRDAWPNNDFGAVPKKAAIVPPFDRSQVAIFTVGITAHHPDDHPKTRFDGHVGVMRVDEGKFVTLTAEVGDQAAAARTAYAHSALHRDTAMIVDVKPGLVPGKFDQLLNFQTEYNTFTLWGHHALEVQDKSWFQHHAIGREMMRARDDIERGRFRYGTLTQRLDHRTPDWRQQLARMAGK